MNLLDKQYRFTELLPFLFQYAYLQGYKIQLGDAWAKDGHRDGSFHYLRLAQDIVLRYDGIWLKNGEDYRFLGEFWQKLDPNCYWGGPKDGGHFSYSEGN